MKSTNQLVKYLLFLPFLLPVLVHAQELTIKIAQDYQQDFVSKQDTFYNLNVEELKPCVNVFGAVPGSTATALNIGNNEFGEGNAVSTVAIPILFQIPATSGQAFQFGSNCGEEGFNSASVNINYNQAPPGLTETPERTRSFNLNIGSNIFVVQDNNPRGYTNQQFLRVNANATNTATISIDEHSEQGNVYINIIQIGGSQKTIAVLNPKQPSQSFVIGEDVMVVPIIKPKYYGSSKELIFEVGDPLRNAKIKVEEEIEEN